MSSATVRIPETHQAESLTDMLQTSCEFPQPHRSSTFHSAVNPGAVGCRTDNPGQWRQAYLLWTGSHRASSFSLAPWPRWCVQPGPSRWRRSGNRKPAKDRTFMSTSGKALRRYQWFF